MSIKSQGQDVSQDVSQDYSIRTYMLGCRTPGRCVKSDPSPTILSYYHTGCAHVTRQQKSLQHSQDRAKLSHTETPMRAPIMVHDFPSLTAAAVRHSVSVVQSHRPQMSSRLHTMYMHVHIAAPGSPEKRPTCIPATVPELQCSCSGPCAADLSFVNSPDNDAFRGGGGFLSCSRPRSILRLCLAAISDTS